MKIKGLNECDFINYKKISMYIIFPYCTLKCDKENNCTYCQNSPLMKEPDIEISCEELVKRYLSNKMSHAIVCAGLEPLDSFEDLLKLVKAFREASDDDFVIYTGYTEEEVSDKIAQLSKFKNLIVKFGRFRPGQESHHDEILGVKLVSDNQYAKYIS